MFVEKLSAIMLKELERSPRLDPTLGISDLYVAVNCSTMNTLMILLLTKRYPYVDNMDIGRYRAFLSLPSLWAAHGSSLKIVHRIVILIRLKIRPYDFQFLKAMYLIV